MDTEMYVILPPGLAPPGARACLDGAMYGTRRASLLWGENITVQLVQEHGFTQVKTCPQAYEQKELGIFCVVHGDEFISESTAKGSDAMDQIMLKSFKTKIKCRLGPGAGLQGKYLHRTIRFIPNVGFEIETDRKHTLLAAKDLGMEDATPVPTPMAVNSTAATNAQDEVSSDRASLFMSVVGRLIYWSIDRYDVQFVVRSLCQDLKSPTEGSFIVLRRLVRYLLGTLDSVLRSC